LRFSSYKLRDMGVNGTHSFLRKEVYLLKF
jgi:hypothetical protein